MDPYVESQHLRIWGKHQKTALKPTGDAKHVVRMARDWDGCIYGHIDMYIRSISCREIQGERERERKRITQAEKNKKNGRLKH